MKDVSRLCPREAYITARLEAEAEANLDELGPITNQQVAQAIKGAPQQTATGLDMWHPRQWDGLPVEAKADLTNLLREVERKQTFPAQALANAIVLVPKPSGDGDRPICLTPGLYRLWGRVRKDPPCHLVGLQ